jgi:uncharacterized protein YbdZ (MbtH family)
MFELYDNLSISEQLLHWVHYMLCGFAVVVACIPFFTPKGSEEHKFGGLIYVPVSCAAFLLASVMAVREASLVLLCFNAFCAYLLLSGWRAIHEKEKPAAIDWLIPGGLFALATLMAAHALIYDEGKRSFYLMFFTFNAFYLAIRDFRHLRRRAYWMKHRIFLISPELAGGNHAGEWLNRHVAGMIGSFLANLSVIVLTLLPVELHWIWPVTLILLAGWIAFKQHRKKQVAQAAVAKVLQPKFRTGVVRPDRDKDIKKAA